MKKYSIPVFAAAFVSGLTLLAGCSTSGEELLPDSITATTPRLAVETRSSGAESTYAHRAFLVLNGAISDTKQASDAAGLGPFSVEPGEYTVYATAASDESNLTFSGGRDLESCF